MKEILGFAKRLGFWVKDIVEDSPVPDEIRYLIFMIVLDKKNYHLEFCGSETKGGVINSPDYFTLDGEYFEDEYSLPIKEYSLLLEEGIDQQFSDINFANIFYRKEILIVLFNDLIIKRVKRGSPSNL